MHLFLASASLCDAQHGAGVAPFDAPLVSAAGSARVKGTRRLNASRVNGQSAGVWAAIEYAREIGLINRETGSDGSRLTNARAATAGQVGIYDALILTRTDLTFTSAVDSWGCDPADPHTLSLAAPCERGYGRRPAGGELCSSDLFYAVPRRYLRGFASAIGVARANQSSDACCFHPTCVRNGGHECLHVLLARGVPATASAIRFCWAPLRSYPSQWFLPHCGWTPGFHSDPCVRSTQMLQVPRANLTHQAQHPQARVGSLGWWPTSRYPGVYCAQHAPTLAWAMAGQYTHRAVIRRACVRCYISDLI